MNKKERGRNKRTQKQQQRKKGQKGKQSEGTVREKRESTYEESTNLMSISMMVALVDQEWNQDANLIAYYGQTELVTLLKRLLLAGLLFLLSQRRKKNPRTDEKTSEFER